VTAANPRTLAEWKQYAESLKGSALRDAAASANSMTFVKVLQEEGYGPEEVHAIIHLLASRFVTLGERPPADGLYDLFEMGKQPAPLKA
jgi:hypothetical protein